MLLVRHSYNIGTALTLVPLIGSCEIWFGSTRKTTLKSTIRNRYFSSKVVGLGNPGWQMRLANIARWSTHQERQLWFSLPGSWDSRNYATRPEQQPARANARKPLRKSRYQNATKKKELRISGFTPWQLGYYKVPSKFVRSLPFAFYSPCGIGSNLTLTRPVFTLYFLCSCFMWFTNRV
jgi:hypothetical protein